jgi:hypothetical protein
MASPFPGMDPYLEGTDVFEEFHNHFASQIQRDLSKALPAGYLARLGSEIILREPSAGERGISRRSDADVIRTDQPGRSAEATAAVAAPRQTLLPVEVREEEVWHVEVITRAGRRVVTHIEILSPSNKRQDRGAYIDKRTRLLRSDVSLVEIDLLRGGPRLPMSEPPEEPFYVIVARAGGRGRADVWPFGLRSPLPTVGVPLLPEDGEVPLDLQATLDRTYDDTGLRIPGHVRYDVLPDPPLSTEELTWAAECLAAAQVG